MGHRMGAFLSHSCVVTCDGRIALQSRVIALVE